MAESDKRKSRKSYCRLYKAARREVAGFSVEDSLTHSSSEDELSEDDIYQPSVIPSIPLSAHNDSNHSVLSKVAVPDTSEDNCNDFHDSANDSVDQRITYSSSDSEFSASTSENEMNYDNSEEFHAGLRSWALKCDIKACHLTELLKFLKLHPRIPSDLPVDSRTFLKTPVVHSGLFLQSYMLREVLFFLLCYRLDLPEQWLGHPKDTWVLLLLLKPQLPHPLAQELQWFHQVHGMLNYVVTDDRRCKCAF
ncbi:hypothetical protein CAPTEDRAFT_191313 [Capitella teleta]|uniref:Uncharacterized protein n=1 Tax=Capitella teleta TaxID=283909 RepID=R7UF39_CAPTE|nr:hypothetical protein CAPTEDRAFT_191313 [Capitella teleta]|eukprot:ELU01887.1 hypothetical protein CAPTEDRAFT_191313 [Capitella teleta]